MADITYNKTSKTLTWGAIHYRAITGGYGLGPLPSGSYKVRVRHVVASPALSSSYENSLTSNRWFIPIEPQFATSRDGFGIHPDGNIPGTKGCIGLPANEAGSFWTRWVNTPLNARPESLNVI